MAMTLTQTPLGEQLTQQLAERRQRDEAAVEQIIGRSHAPEPGDAGELAALVERMKLDPTDVQSRLAAHVEQHASRQRLDGLRNRLADLTAESRAREAWRSAFGAVPDFAAALDTLIEAIVAAGYADANTFPNFTKPALTAAFLRARGWKLVSPFPEVFQRDEVQLVASQARDRQFRDDLAPLLPAIQSYEPLAAAAAAEPVDDAGLDAAVADAERRLEALPPIDPHQAKLVEIARAVVVLYVERPTDAATINASRAVLRRELPSVLPEYQIRLHRAANGVLGMNVYPC